MHTKKKKITLQTAGPSRQVSNKSKKDKQVATSIRFELDLSESNEKEYPVFNYAELLKSAEEKRRKEKKKVKNGVPGGEGHFDDDDDDKVLDIARHFEKKYGNRKDYDYMDLGAGYDEEDSFIDNTDAYDEVVPEEITTAHGGFYINTGPLEFKESDIPKPEDFIDISGDTISGNDNESGKGNESDDDRDVEDEEESTGADSQDEVVSKKVNKRTLSSSEEDVQKMSHMPKSKVKRAKC